MFLTPRFARCRDKHRLRRHLSPQGSRTPVARRGDDQGGRPAHGLRQLVAGTGVGRGSATSSGERASSSAGGSGRMGREEPSRPQGSCDESADQGRSCHGLDLPSPARQAVGGRSCRLGVERGQTSRASRRLKRGRAPTTPLCAMCGGWSTPEPAVWVAADRRRDCGRWLAVRADLSRIRCSATARPEGVLI